MKGKMLKCINVAIAILVILASFILYDFNRPAMAKDVIKLKFASALSPTSPPGISDVWYIEQLEKRTGGRVKVRPHWSGALGGIPELLELSRKGAVDLVSTAPAFYPSTFPLAMDTAVGLLNISSLAGWDKNALFTDMFRSECELVKEEIQSKNLKMLRVGAMMPYQVLSTRPVNSLADLRGRKMRIMSAGFIPLWEAAGMVPVSVAQAETYEALLRGTLDATAIDTIYAVSAKLSESAKYMLDINIPVPMINLMMNLDSWNKLPSDVKTVMENLTSEARQWSFSMLKEKNAEARKILQNSGVTFTKISDEEIAKWKAEGLPKVKEYRLGLAVKHGVTRAIAEKVWNQGEQIMRREGLLK